MEEEREQGGTTLGEIFRTIFSQKWIALAIAAVITIAGTLCIYFVMNDRKREYAASFVLNLPGASENSFNYIYPDGTAFYFSDIVSFNTLKAVKESNDAFSNINVNGMADGGKISITRTQSSEKENTETLYTITVKANSFESKNQARDFIVALANTPGNYLTKMDIEYDAYIVAAEGSIDYENEISYLTSQINYLIDQYNVLINEYRPDFVIKESKTLQNYQQEVRSYLETNILGSLITQARLNGYLKDAKLADYYRTEIQQLSDEIEDAQFTLDKMLQGQSDQSQNAEAIRNQADKVATLKRRQTYLQNYVDHSTLEVPQDYLNSLQTAYASVNKFTSDFKAAASAVYSTTATVSFTTSNVLTTQGETGLVFSFIISLVVGLIIAAIVAYIVGKAMMKKRAAVVTRQPEACIDAQAQAAVADEEEKEDE